MKIIYMVYPASGDGRASSKRAGAWARWAEENFKEVAVVVPQATEHEIASTHGQAWLRRNLAVLARCDELWLAGNRVSEDMAAVLARAKELNKRVRDFTGFGKEWPPTDGHDDFCGDAEEPTVELTALWGTFRNTKGGAALS